MSKDSPVERFLVRLVQTKRLGLPLWILSVREGEATIDQRTWAHVLSMGLSVLLGGRRTWRLTPATACVSVDRGRPVEARTTVTFRHRADGRPLLAVAIEGRPDAGIASQVL